MAGQKIPVSVEGGDERWIDVQPGAGQNIRPTGKVQWSPDQPRSQDTRRTPGYESFKVTIHPPERPA